MIATGNWGCGAFRGDRQLKFIIQWIAASLAEKQMIFCPYGKNNPDHKILEPIKLMKIEDTYAFLLGACN
jgi:poly(ADP-ribose) glycohydrolase